MKTRTTRTKFDWTRFDFSGVSDIHVTLTLISLIFFLFFVLFIPSLAHAENFGHSRLTVQRTWIIQTSGEFEFNASLAVNDSNQHLLLFSVSPGMQLHTDNNGNVWLYYKGNGSEAKIILTANSTIDIDYDPHIMSDSVLDQKPIAGTDLTAADNNISFFAQSIAHQDSALVTVRDLVNWVHENITYDINYWGKSVPATQVFRERQGVCVEYAHLLIAMAHSLGLDARYVSGYVFTSSWQPHAWAEIYLPNYGWLAADPTFGQVGSLGNTHLAIHKGSDQSSAYDTLSTIDENSTIEAEIDIVQSVDSEDPKGAAVQLNYDNSSRVLGVTVSNTRSEYLYGTYTMLAPERYGGQQSKVLLLDPHESIHIYHNFNPLNSPRLADGMLYSVPVMVSFNDARVNTSISVNELELPGNGFGLGNPGDYGNNGNGSSTSCMMGFAVLAILVLAGCIRAYSC